jgi:hypothetical protein
MNILRFPSILIALIGSVSLSIAPMAFAQSDEDSTPSASESDGIPRPPLPGADYLKLPPTSATDNFSFSGTTDQDWEEVPETIPSAPPSVADHLKDPPTLATDGFSGRAGRLFRATHELEVPETNFDSIDEQRQVLEIPQAVNPAQTPNGDPLIERTFMR